MTPHEIPSTAPHRVASLASTRAIRSTGHATAPPAKEVAAVADPSRADGRRSGERPRRPGSTTPPWQGPRGRCP